MENLISVSLTYFVSVLLIIVVIRCLLTIALPRSLRTALYRGFGGINKNISKRYNDYLKEKERNKVTELKETKLKKVTNNKKDSFDEDLDIKLNDLKRTMLFDIEIIRNFFEELPEEYNVSKELGIMRTLKKETLKLNIPEIVSQEEEEKKAVNDNKKVVNIKDKSKNS